MSAGAGLSAASIPRGEARWVGFRTIVIREFSRIVRIWGQTLVPPAITASLYFLIFGSLIGRRIGEMSRFTYMQYIAPGLNDGVKGSTESFRFYLTIQSVLSNAA